jgi:SpoIIAA-like
MFDWDRFAVVTDVEWISRTTKFMAMFMPMEGRVYPIAEAAKAREWIGET